MVAQWPRMERSDSKRLDRRVDGFGTRWFDPQGGRIEVLDLASALSTPDMEQAIRARLATVAGYSLPVLAPVRRVERNAQTLSVVTATPVGVPLSELLAAAEFDLLDLPDETVFAAARAIVNRVAALHALPAPFVHGALGAAHVLLQVDGSVVFTGWAFSDALAQLGRSRADYWSEFGLVMPLADAAAVDQRSDVTQLGFLVLSLLLRRVPCGRGDADALDALIEDAAATQGLDDAIVRPLHEWLANALQLGDAPFPSAVAAGAAFEAIPFEPDRRGAAGAGLALVVRQMCGDVPMPPIGARRDERTVLAAAV